jgi:hypothetical protein
VLGTSCASDGLATLHGLAGRQQPVALLIVSHAMSEMPGVEFLARAHELHPLAKRILLVERTTRRAGASSACLGAADPEPHGFICWAAVEIVFQDVR